MWLLLACAPPPPPALAVPTPLVTAETAEAVPVDTMWMPTALGARDDTLCAWARGESVPTATLARWSAERRFTWRMVVVGPAGATFAGSADVRRAAEQAVDDIHALEARCGVTLGRDVLVAAAPDTPYRPVSDALYALARGGLEGRWLVVDDSEVPRIPPRASSPEPEPPAAEPRSWAPASPAVLAALRAAPGGDRLLVALEDDGSTWTSAQETAVVGPLPTRLASARFGCGLISADPAVPWSRVIDALDTFRRAGVDGVKLGLAVDARVGAATPTTPSPPQPTSVTPFTLRGAVPALPIALPQYCAEGEVPSECGCYW